MPALGLDIGGANLKAADETGRACSEPFELWRAPDQLTARLQAILARFPECDDVALTMTAELADCFETKAKGVDFIVRCAQQAAGKLSLRLWSTQGRFVYPADARANPLEVAAANWHALARWAGRLAPEGVALLIDIGSTTTDIIPLRDGVPCPAGLTDIARLQSGELVYTGVRRTPLCAVTHIALFRGRLCPLTAELFATMLDVHLLRGRIPENTSDTATANGRPATVEGARDRLARLVCCDRDEMSHQEISDLAEFFAHAQLSTLAQAVGAVIARQPERPETVVLSGSGEFLARDVVARHPVLADLELISLSEMLTASVAEAACAYAVAILAGEQTS